MHKQQGWPQAWEYCQAKLIKHLRELHKDWTEAGVSASRVTTLRHDLGCHVICWCWSTVFSEVHSQHSHLPGHFGALHASFCWQALWRYRFHFPAGLGTCTHCQRYQKLVQWPWCYCACLASKLAWPEPHRESMGYCQEEDKRQSKKSFSVWKMEWTALRSYHNRFTRTLDKQTETNLCQNLVRSIQIQNRILLKLQTSEQTPLMWKPGKTLFNKHKSPPFTMDLT